MAAPDMFTRGQPGEPDNRGESLVQLHMDRMQQQREAAAMDKLRQLMPQLGDMIRALALSKSEWDIDKAVSMLRSFQVAHLDKVNALNKKRKKLREAMEACTGSEEPEDQGGGSGPSSGSSSGASSSSSDSGSSSDGDEEDGPPAKRSSPSQKDSRKDKKRSSSSKKKKESSSKKRRSSSSKKHKKRSSKDKDKDKDKDKKRRSKKRKHADSSGDEDDEAARAKKLTHSQDFGKYGYIREGDLSVKQTEFMLWASEVKGVNPELLGRTEEKELFKEYMEDYNTGTLKHRKYYNLEAYEREQAVKAAAKQRDRDKGAAAGAAAMFDARADEEVMRRQRMEERMKGQQERLAQAYTLLKHTDRAKDMREQELLRAEMTLAYKTGDRARAQKLFERLQPDDQKK